MFLQLFSYIICLSIINFANTRAWEELEFVEYEKWYMEPEKFAEDMQAMPAIPCDVILSESDSPMCNDKASCIVMANYLIFVESEKYHIPQQASKHFYIGGDGRVYVGRGWDYLGEETYYCGYNKPIIEIVFIGKLKAHVASSIQLRTAQKLLEYGILNNKLSPSYELYAEWKLQNKTGRKINNINFRIIRTWPHWAVNKTICEDEFDNFIPMAF